MNLNRTMNYYIRQKIRGFYFKLIGKPHLTSSDSYINWLRKKGIKIGRGTIIRNTQNIHIDIQRPELIEIGDNVLLHSGTTILNHDFASRAFINAFSDYIPSHSKIKIGNNVWLGQNVSILKGVTIGDNVIIGYGSIVTRSIPSNSIAVGCPAKVIGSFTDYYQRRKKDYIEECINLALAIYDSGRTPTIKDFERDYPAFVDGSNYKEYDFDYFREFTPTQFEQWKLNHHAPFHGFDEFMKVVNAKKYAQ